MDTPPQSSNSPPDSDALHVVLFGAPAAGKSSLLGALAEAAQTQEHVLNGRLADPTHGLRELQHRLYDGEPRETLEEIVPYPMTFAPFASNGQTLAETHAVLVDSDGRVANDLISRRRSLEAGGSEDGLANQILHADALVLAVDASASVEQVEAEFAEFGRFLHLLEENRGKQTDIGDLPVFLVLTKCDLLAKPNDTQAAWMNRIEECKRQTSDHFRGFLARDGAPALFGSIDLNVRATAVKRPPLAGSPAQPREPYGVAELFRECLAEAVEFRGRREQSHRRLRRTVAGAAGLAVAMLALAGGLLATRPAIKTTDLEDRIENYKAEEGPSPASWVREPLQDRISALRRFKQDADFTKLPEALKQYVSGRLEELEDYRSFKTGLERIRSPAEARNDPELNEIESHLLRDLAMLPKYEADWRETPVGRLRRERLDDIAALRAAVAQTDEWYGSLKRRGDELRLFSDRQAPGTAPVSWVDWQAQVNRLLNEADHPPFRRADVIPGSTTVTYAAVLAWDRVAEAHREWERVRQGLERLRDLSAALGLAGLLPDRPAFLRIPESGFTLENARNRWQELGKSYPRFREWLLVGDVPDPVAVELRRAAEASYRSLLKIGQEIVLRRLRQVAPDSRETPQAWQEVAKWLVATDEFRDWRELTTLLGRLHDPKVDDPVMALATFLQRDRFDLELRGLTLLLPDELKLRPVRKLTIFHGSGEKGLPALSFHIDGEGSRDPRQRVTRYRFVPDQGTSLVARPGDALWASLDLKDADNAGWTLTWMRDHSGTFQFERLSRPPRVHRSNEGPEKGKLLEERSWLTVVPENGVPRVPDLLPIVPLENR